jgi:hypothetical protein
MPNALAYLALLGWPVVCLAAFARFRVPVAVLVCQIGAMLLLPEKTEIRVPFQPLGKQEMAAIGTLLGLLLVGAGRKKLWKAKPLWGAEAWVYVIMLGAWGTSDTNKEPLSYGMTTLESLTTWEAISVAVGDIYTYLIPFIIGRAVFTSRADALTLLRSFQVAAFLYLPFIVIELLLSPQMHYWVYGFAQHDFIQTMRGGGYRPMVFTGHGLALSLFLAAGVLAGMVLTLAKAPGVLRIRGRYVSAFLLLVLISCKSLGAALFAFLFIGLLHALSPRWQMRMMVMLAAVIVLYPVSRAVDVFPHREIVQFVKDTAGPDRAQSIEFRFTNEEALAAHATKKPLYGWGRYRRSMLFIPFRETPVSVADGFWIAIYGQRGAVGFLCLFGMLLTPVFFLRSRMKRIVNREDRYLLVGLTCIGMMYTVDLLPNGLFTNYPVFFAGALMGLIRGMTTNPAPAAVIAPRAPTPTPMTSSVSGAVPVAFGSGPVTTSETPRKQ